MIAALAQSVERRSRKAKVSGSIPEGGSEPSSKIFHCEDSQGSISIVKMVTLQNTAVFAQNHQE